MMALASKNLSYLLFENFVRNFVMNPICFNRSKMLSMRWVLAIFVCGLLLVCTPLPALATITQLEEYPGQMLYQSRQNLQDQTGQSWQAIAFTRIHPQGRSTVSLRLVGFPGTVELDHAQPLTLTISSKGNLTARDISSEISQDSPTLANVAEYDIKSVLPQLKSETPLQLILPVVTGAAIELKIPSAAIEEWQTISTHHE
jgi:Protein of unknown function (DUF3122)